MGLHLQVYIYYFSNFTTQIKIGYPVSNCVLPASIQLRATFVHIAIVNHYHHYQSAPTPSTITTINYQHSIIIVAGNINNTLIVHG